MIQTSTRGERQRAKYERKYPAKIKAAYKQTYLKLKRKSNAGVTYTHYKKVLIVN